MRVIVIGATGMIGSRVVTEAQSRGHHVTSASRSGKDGTQVTDASNPSAVADIAAGYDAVVLSVRLSSQNPPISISPILEGLRNASVRRLIVVGGAGSLEVAPGVRLLEAIDIPDEYRDEVFAQVAVLDSLRADADDLEWTYISPGGMIEPGERTGVFRTGGDQVLLDENGTSRISAEDFAVALLDELEKGTNIGRRINIAY